LFRRPSCGLAFRLGAADASGPNWVQVNIGGGTLGFLQDAVGGPGQEGWVHWVQGDVQIGSAIPASSGGSQGLWAIEIA
jgi:hypothetical protein